MRPVFLWSLVLSLASFVSVRMHLALNDELARESRSTLYRQPIQQSRPRRRVKERARNENSAYQESFKLLAFGFSWDSSDVIEYSEAYPSLLSPNSRLITLSQARDPPVVALACTQSIVGDEWYHVITIEFYEWTGTHQLLAERLRSRFPEAALILVRLWRPSQIVYTGDDGTTVDLDTWRGNLTLHSNEVGLRVLESGGPDRWSLKLPDDQNLLDDARFRLRASIFTLAGPAASDFNFPLNLNAYLTFFDPDEPDRFTARGHSVLHLGLQALLQQMNIRQPQSSPKLGSWGTGDDCHVWYSTGQYPESNSARRLEITSAVDRNSSHHKHALELQPHDTLQAHNPFGEPRMLFLTYLTSCDDHDDRVYPRMRVHVNGKPTVVIDPYHDDCSRSHHLTRTSPVGQIPPGDSTLQFYPLDASSLNFRLVGASLLFESAASQVDLALEPEPSLPMDSWGVWY